MEQAVNLIREACIDSLKAALTAQIKGADRTELCGDLSVGGITPNYALIQAVQQKCTIPTKVMIRPRGGNFVYSEKEIRQMEKDIDFCKKNNIPEVVFGILTPDNQIDIINTQRLAKRAFPMKITFHKAIDEVNNIPEAVEILNALPEITSVLTSGGQATAFKGREMLKQMQSLARPSLKIIAAGKITDQNIHLLHSKINLEEYHGKLIVGSLI